ncbi:MAG: TIGR00282 family metallophosphoesterase [Candidatus Zixiibacteriota bacterium]|nr:MAG: TIGR00282 family metallophosphoesterase [candidate division Zixibacteria bacterium]
MNILFVADIVGKPGRWAVSQLLPDLLRTHQIDFVIANVENAAGGFGLTKEIAKKIHSYGVDCLTSGNHIWDRKDIYPYLDEDRRILRPANYPPDAPGRGVGVFESASGRKVGVLNIQGRVYIKEIDCPFRVAEQEIEKLKRETKVIIVDLHAEATSEKVALGRYLDGRVSAVLGSHTHVQTADEAILPAGTAYITDVGMTGPHDSVIGVNTKDALARFLLQIPHRFTLGRKDVKFSGVLVGVDPDTGKATDIERIKIDIPSPEDGEEESGRL